MGSISAGEPIVLEVGDANPEEMAKRLFGKLDVVSSNIRCRDTEDGFLVEYGRIPLRAVACFFAVIVLIGAFLAKEDFVAWLCMSLVAMVMMIGLFYAINESHKQAGALIKSESSTGNVVVDSKVSFHLQQLEMIFDVRGDVKNGCYRQASALVRKPEGRFLYRLFHQFDESCIRDDFVVKIAKRLSVQCRVIDKVKFIEEPEN